MSDVSLANALAAIGFGADHLIIESRYCINDAGNTTVALPVIRINTVIHRTRLVIWIGNSERFGIALIRVAIAVEFLWVGALKCAPYEVDSITPFVANSP